MTPSVVNVQIVRPKKETPAFVGQIVGQVIAYLINGFTLMLILGSVSPWHPGYVTSLLVIVAARCLVPASTSDYLSWTKKL